ncbi:hypothetical protein PRK78_007094 [Emydomyces testavorans]|uniref:Zn(2)-C6 fungal-type domain-containing protein n=1 Tax=Emydomyces testavorans TaxID=2070801 RepID=A0AAF0ILC9_9EURO|nr:hypothetical protein PRK78_007094 [Emydomyces testavorans]
MSSSRSSNPQPTSSIPLAPPQCRTCRKRRIRCDSAKPSCQKCTSRGLECLGYGSQKPLVWLQGGGSQNQYLGEQNMHPSERKKRKKGRPRLVPASDDEVVRGDKVGESAGLRQLALSRARVDNFIFPDLDPIIYYPCVHATEPTSWQEDVTHRFWDILITVVATHKAVRSQAIDQVEFSKEIYQYKDRTFKSLTKDLIHPKTQLGDDTLICVLALFMSEMQRSAKGEWWAHFEGARKIINLRGGLRAVSVQNPVLRSSLVYFMLADIMSATTTSALPIKEAARQLEYRELISDIFQNGSETCVLCPNALLDAIIQINHLRALRHHPIETCTNTGENTVRSIMQSILSFPLSEWADSRSNHYSQTAADALIGEARSGFIQPTRNDWFQIASIYYAAVLLYCIRSLALDLSDELLSQPRVLGPSDPAVSYVAVKEIQTMARHILFDCLHTVLSPKEYEKRPLEKVLIWPIFIAGVEAAMDPEYVDERRFIADALHNMSKALGTLTLRDAKLFLRELSSRMSERDRAATSQLWWDDIFRNVKGRCAFFM